MNTLMLALVACVLATACAGGIPNDRYYDELLESKNREIAERDAKLAEEQRKREEAEATVHAVDEYLQEEKGMHVADIPRQATPEPVETPAPNDPFGIGYGPAPATAIPYGVFFNGQAAGTVGNTASYVNRNPQRGPCQGMCVEITNHTRRQEDIMIVVDMEIQTIFGGFKPLVEQALVTAPDGTQLPGLVTLLPYDQKTQWRMDLTGDHDITVMGYITQNDGWLVPTGYTTETRTFPGRFAFGYVNTIRGFQHRI